jgi:hypothetical protein
VKQLSECTPSQIRTLLHPLPVLPLLLSSAGAQGFWPQISNLFTVLERAFFRLLRIYSPLVQGRSDVLQTTSNELAGEVDSGLSVRYR